MKYKYVGNSTRRIGQYVAVKPGDVIELSEESAARLSGLLQRVGSFGGKQTQGSHEGFVSKRILMTTNKKENRNA